MTAVRFPYITRSKNINSTIAISAPVSVSKPTRTAWLQVVLLLVALGLACSAYLLARHFAIISGSGAAQFNICQAVFGGDCDAAMRSALAVQFGIPLAGWGLVHFLMVATALAIAYSLGDSFRTEGTQAALFFCTVATLAGGVLTAIMVSGSAPFCPLCVVVHGVNLLLLPAIVIASGQSMAELYRPLVASCTNVFRGKTADQPQVGWKITGLITVALVGVVGYQWVLLQTNRRVAKRATPPTFEQVLKEYQAADEVELPLSDDDPWLGSPQSKLQLVIFNDFQCPFCRQLATFVAEMKQQRPEMAVVFKHFPLANACNSKSNSHPFSCDVAYAAEAAHRQGKFWSFHDALFAADKELTGDALAEIAKTADCDSTRWKNDLTNPATKAKVAADVALGIRLNIAGTPTVLLNRRPIPNGGLRYLNQLVEYVAKQGRA